MDVRMMLQGLAPGVKNHGHTELGAEMPGIGRDGGECLSRRAEQDRVDDGLVLERDLADRCRQCEDDMKVRHRQQFGLPIREPLGPRQPLAFGTARAADSNACTGTALPINLSHREYQPFQLWRLTQSSCTALEHRQCARTNRLPLAAAKPAPTSTVSEPLPLSP